jgi:hypothetical protein
MPSSGMLRRVALVISDVSEELNVSVIRVTRIGELETSLVAGTSKRRTHFLLSRASPVYTTPHGKVEVPATLHNTNW